jgi:hypothetical protein
LKNFNFNFKNQTETAVVNGLKLAQPNYARLQLEEKEYIADVWG